LKKPKRTSAVLLGAVLAASAITGCGVLKFSKDGETNAKSACENLRPIADDDISREEVLKSLAKAADLSLAAAEANEEYDLLHSGFVTLLETALLGSSYDAFKFTWTNVAERCIEIFEE